MSKINYRLIRIILLFGFMQLIYFAFCYLTIHGILSSYSASGEKIITLCLIILQLFLFISLNRQKNKALTEKIILWLNVAFLLFILIILLCVPYTLGRELISLYRSATVYVPNPLILYSGAFHLVLTGAFFSNQTNDTSEIKKLFMIFSFALIPLLYFILKAFTPSMEG